jgi:hypothetical protein
MVLTIFPRADRDVVEASATTLVRDKAGPLSRPLTADPAGIVVDPWCCVDDSAAGSLGTSMPLTVRGS